MTEHTEEEKLTAIFIAMMGQTKEEEQRLIALEKEHSYLAEEARKLELQASSLLSEISAKNAEIENLKAEILKAETSKGLPDDQEQKEKYAEEQAEKYAEEQKEKYAEEQAERDAEEQKERDAEEQRERDAEESIAS